MDGKKKNLRESLCMAGNSRLDELQAGILVEKVKSLDEDNLRGLKIASIYNKAITSKHVITPKKRRNSSHVYHLYVIKCKNRDKLLAYLKK